MGKSKSSALLQGVALCCTHSCWIARNIHDVISFAVHCVNLIGNITWAYWKQIILPKLITKIITKIITKTNNTPKLVFKLHAHSKRVKMKCADKIIQLTMYVWSLEVGCAIITWCEIITFGTLHYTFNTIWLWVRDKCCAVWINTARFLALF